MTAILGKSSGDSTGNFAGNFESAAVTTGDIPDGFWGWWWDTVNSELFSVRNRAGVLYYVEATPG